MNDGLPGASREAKQEEGQGQGEGWPTVEETRAAIRECDCQREAVEAKIRAWRKRHSQSDPGAAAEYREYVKELIVIERKMRIVKRLLELVS
jgi:hypothetical protein